MTYKIVCTHPVNGASTVAADGLATLAEAQSVCARMQTAESLSDCSRRTGVTLVLTIESVDR